MVSGWIGNESVGLTRRLAPAATAMAIFLALFIAHSAEVPTGTISVPLTNSCSSTKGTPSSAENGHPMMDALANPIVASVILFHPPSTGESAAPVPTMTPHIAKVDGRNAVDADHMAADEMNAARR